MGKETRRRVALRGLYERYSHDPAFEVLRAGARRLVPGAGSVEPPLLLVGEAPGETEDKLGAPFLGASGRLLDKLLASVDIEREDCWITNVVKYRPVNSEGKNRPPLPSEKEASAGYLWSELHTLGRPGVVALGRHALGVFMSQNCPMGEWQYVNGWWVLPLRHPAYGLYQAANQPKMFEQFKAVKEQPWNRGAQSQ